METQILSNLNVVALFNTPGNMATGPKWKAALYIDERATQEQKDSNPENLFRTSGRIFCCGT